MPFSSGSSSPGIEPRSPALQADSLPSKPPGKNNKDYSAQNVRCAEAKKPSLKDHKCSP